MCVRQTTREEPREIYNVCRVLVLAHRWWYHQSRLLPRNRSGLLDDMSVCGFTLPCVCTLAFHNRRGALERRLSEEILPSADYTPHFCRAGVNIIEKPDEDLYIQDSLRRLDAGDLIVSI